MNTLGKVCLNLKERYYKCLNTYRNNTCDENRVEMVRAGEVIDIKKNYSNTVHDSPMYTKKAFPFSNTARYTLCYNASPGKLYVYTSAYSKQQPG